MAHRAAPTMLEIAARIIDPKSQYVETFSGKPVEGRPHISILDWGTSRFSADLESGRRPELKSAEKREVPLVIVELFSMGVEIARRFRYHLLGFWVKTQTLSCGTALM